MNFKKYVSVCAVMAVVLGLGIATTSFADNSKPGKNPSMGQFGGKEKRENFPPMGSQIVGKVSAVNGFNLTVVCQKGFGTTTASTTFAVDATNAKVFKNNATTTVSNIVVGDNIIVQGTINGTNVVATIIRDGKINSRMDNGGFGKNNNGNGLQIEGNGQPVVIGTVSALNGSTITIKNKGSVEYVVDAANAKIVQGKETGSISNIALGDNVIVQGTINGNSIVATTIIEQMKPTKANGKMIGVFGKIGGFFSKLFGF